MPKFKNLDIKPGVFAVLVVLTVCAVIAYQVMVSKPSTKTVEVDISPIPAPIQGQVHDLVSTGLLYPTTTFESDLFTLTQTEQLQEKNHEKRMPKPPHPDSVLLTDKGGTAIVQGKLVSVGDVVAGWHVTKIIRDGVIFVRRGHKKMATIF